MLDRASMRFIELALASAGVLAAAGPARADEGRSGQPDDKVAKADALFAEGVKLRDSNLELACAKFGESLQLNPQAIGVLLNVAMCDEKHGRIASAVRRYRETRERALEQSFPEYLKAADGKLAALAPDVPLLTIRFAKPPPPNTKIVVDEQVVPLSALEKLPLDPGERTIVVSAPGRISFQRKISIAKGERRELAVPPLERPSSRRTIGKISVAAGGAAITAGVVLGLVARSRYNRYADDMARCTRAEGGPLICESSAYSGVRSALQLGDIGSIVGGVGIAAVLAGSYLWFFAPKPYAEQRRVSVVPRVTPGGGGLAVFGRF
jgi:hypothetical protein